MLVEPITSILLTLLIILDTTYSVSKQAFTYKLSKYSKLALSEPTLSSLSGLTLFENLIPQVCLICKNCL